MTSCLLWRSVGDECLALPWSVEPMLTYTNASVALLNYHGEGAVECRGSDQMFNSRKIIFQLLYDFCLQPLTVSRILQNTNNLL